MTFTTGPMVYVMIWVVVLFIVLPWGVSIPDKIEKGHATSAPSNPHMGIKLLVTSVLSFLVWIVAYLILKV